MLREYPQLAPHIGDPDVENIVLDCPSDQSVSLERAAMDKDLSSDVCRTPLQV
jgi:hypothetical protein